MKTEFTRTLTSRATIKKQKYYEFDFTDEDIEKGRKATYDNPHFVKGEKSTIWFALYTYQGKLTAKMFHSYDKFEEAC